MLSFCDPEFAVDQIDQRLPRIAEAPVDDGHHVSISSTRNASERICNALCARSPIAMTETSDGSLNSDTHEDAKTGKTRLNLRGDLDRITL